MHYQVTVRYAGRYQRYHTYVVEAENARVALTAAGEQMPVEIAAEADLVELRVAVDPEKRAYLDDVAP